MNRNLTKRESTLLYMLFLFIVVFGTIYFGTLPMLTENNELSMQVDELNYTLMDIMTRETNIQLLKRNVELNDVEIKDSKSIYPKFMHNEELDRFFTTLVSLSGFSPMRLSLSGAGEELEEIGLNGSINDSGLTFREVNITALGDEQSVLNLINTVSDMPYIRLSRLTYSASSPEYSISLVIFTRNP